MIRWSLVVSVQSNKEGNFGLNHEQKLKKSVRKCNAHNLFVKSPIRTILLRKLKVSGAKIKVVYMHVICN